MNRLVTPLLTEALPPLRSDGRTRMLFLTLDGMGWATYASSISATTAVRDDIDAVHIRFKSQGLKRLLSIPVPGGHGLLDSQTRRVLLAGWRIRRWIDRRFDLSRFDVIHATPQQYGLGFTAALADRLPPLSTRIDATVYQANGELWGRDNAEVKRLYAPLIRIERSVLDAARLVVASSDWAAEGARSAFGVPDDKLLVLPLSLPLPSTRAAPRQSRSLPRILFIGNDFHRKGGDRLLEWHQQRWADRSELVLCTSHQIRHRGRNVVHLGCVPHERLLSSVIPSADVFVMPTWHDMSPWAVLEASSGGLPVVSSRIGGISEMVVDGVTGYLCRPDDGSAFVTAVEKLIDEPSLRHRMGVAGAARATPAEDRSSNNNKLLDRLIDLAGDTRRG